MNVGDELKKTCLSVPKLNLELFFYKFPPISGQQEMFFYRVLSALTSRKSSTAHVQLKSGLNPLC